MANNGNNQKWKNIATVAGLGLLIISGGYNIKHSIDNSAAAVEEIKNEARMKYAQVATNAAQITILREQFAAMCANIAKIEKITHDISVELKANNAELHRRLTDHITNDHAH